MKRDGEFQKAVNRHVYNSCNRAVSYIGSAVDAMHSLQTSLLNSDFDSTELRVKLLNINRQLYEVSCELYEVVDAYILPIAKKGGIR